jgi:hypothetical protein
MVIEELVADKGYHEGITVYDLETLEIRAYISEPDRGPRSWTELGSGRQSYGLRNRDRAESPRKSDYARVLCPYRYQSFSSSFSHE